MSTTIIGLIGFTTAETLGGTTPTLMKNGAKRATISNAAAILRVRKAVFNAFVSSFESSVKSTRNVNCYLGDEYLGF